MASLFLVGLELGFYNLMVVECPCKENPASGWLMTRSHTSFSWLVGWMASLLLPILVRAKLVPTVETSSQADQPTDAAVLYQL